MSAFELTFKVYGKSAILIEWPSEIDKNILEDVILFKSKILKSYIKGIVDVINSYNSLTIVYNIAINNIYSEILNLKSLYSLNISQESVENFRWEIPVCYDKKFGIDLHEFQVKNNLNFEEVVRIHSSSIYTVYFIGFLPGFMYLGGLDKRLHIARKSNPRLRVEKGSVAIGGNQTGVYPSINAGGWHIIGNSPITFFDSKLAKPCFAKSGDEIKFIPVDVVEYNQIESEVEKGVYKLKKSKL
ncbi:5-oxoprolinase subunit PxpB [Aureibaculum marinum]|uniref:5-oxoprolinase subunit PxpB n=1 Tax=Aureibaculum marinum TaxID=2487930 RepID=A0A3N4NQN3_9FLAO|nr:5-oxoprolinase subunit PxpB [Aureibaculum marinum]RPD98611.1 5-oxoprolinase subunit PxpB [Aureibaculum marinum]